MSVRFYADEHLPGPITRGLTRRGVDVLTVQLDNRIGESDSRLVQRATELGRVLLSSDKDYFAIVAREQAAGRTFSGVISVPASLSYRAAINDLELVAKCSEPGEWEARIVRLPL
jgi:hypothetical protein